LAVMTVEGLLVGLQLVRFQRGVDQQLGFLGGRRARKGEQCRGGKGGEKA
jgi:hypothetical protein